MRAERDRRAAILTAEGVKQSQILTAEGEKQSAILRAEGQAQAAILKAQGESKAITQVFDAIHRGDADPKLLAYQYLQMLPQIANGTASKMWIVPTEFTAALNGIAGAFGAAPVAGPPAGDGGETATDRARREHSESEDDPFSGTELQDPQEALRQARSSASEASGQARSAGTLSGRPFDLDAEIGQRPAGESAPAPTSFPEPGTGGYVPPRPAE